jgi:hypothetical protein
MIFLCVTAFGILNGLLSTFAGSFSGSNARVFEDAGRREGKLRKLKDYVYGRLMKVNDQFIDETDPIDEVEDCESDFGQYNSRHNSNANIPLSPSPVNRDKAIDKPFDMSTKVSPSNPQAPVPLAKMDSKITTSRFLNRDVRQKSSFITPTTPLAVRAPYLGNRAASGIDQALNSFSNDDIANMIKEMRDRQEEIYASLVTELSGVRSLRQEHDEIKRGFSEALDAMKFEIDKLSATVRASVIITPT